MFSSYQVTASFLLAIVYEGANGMVADCVFWLPLKLRRL